MSNNFTGKAEAALNRAVTIAEELGHTYVGSEHILLSLAMDETCCASMLLRKRKITYERLEAAVKEYSGVGTKSTLSSKDTTPKCRRILEGSYKCSKKYSSPRIGTEHILLTLLDEKESVSAKLLIKIEADTVSLKDDVVSFLRNTERGVCIAEPVNENVIPNLLKYGRQINKLAERGVLDPCIGREKEIERLIRILSRKTKNNPCLIGEAGVGKTAIVEGLVQRINDGRVPSTLIGKTVISLDLTSMVAGAKYRGDFEERIKSVMNEAAKNKSVILFIDEIHTIVGAGSAEGAIDAANIMKPELSRGEIQLIGATTISEYRKYIEKDAALERRFQPVLVEEPTVDGAVEILMGLRERYEEHHKIRIEDSAIRSAVTLSKRYVQDRFLPDKAIDILDEACAMASVRSDSFSEKTKDLKEKLRQISSDRKKAVSTQDFEMAAGLKELERLYTLELSEELTASRAICRENSVSEADVLRVIFEITGIDLSEEGKTKNDMKARLSRSIIGQDLAVKMLSEAVLRGLAGVNDPDRPRGIFLFLGESGVGKTALAKELAKQLFHSEDAIIRLDMSEYSESFSTSKLIGSAPGYIGYEEHSSAFERVRRRPYSVLLLDEIEKAHPDVLSLFLQIFDTGYITDSTGRKISFKNCYIIMTSNIGADKFRQSASVGFISSADQDAIHKRLEPYFKPEFINRIDEIIPFSPLDISALKEIAKIKLSVLCERIKRKGIHVLADENVYSVIAKSSVQSGLGARPINRFILSKIENPIASMIVEENLVSGDRILISADNGEIMLLREERALSKM